MGPSLEPAGKDAYQRGRRAGDPRGGGMSEIVIVGGGICGLSLALNLHR